MKNFRFRSVTLMCAVFSLGVSRGYSQSEKDYEIGKNAAQA